MLRQDYIALILAPNVEQLRLLLGVHYIAHFKTYEADGDIRHPCTRSRARARAQHSAYLGLWMDDTCPAPAPSTFQSGRANPT